MVVVLLPLPQATDPVHPRGTMTGLHLDGMRILFVDDQAETVEPLCLYLRQFGADVRLVAAAAEALAAVREYRFHVLVSDLAMPSMDGIDLIEAIRKSQREPYLPALALSAHGEKQYRDEATKAGFDDYLLKPVYAPALIEAIIAVTRWPEAFDHV